MKRILQNLEQVLGILGTLLLAVIFINEPSFPTPDKILIFLIFVFMIFNQAKAMLKHLLPFIVLLLVYDSFRSVANNINTHVDYLTAPHFDEFFFGDLPTTYLQNWLWDGHVKWYDFVFYAAYMLHFIIPIALAILVWKTCEKYYSRVIGAYLITAFAAFVTFFVMPAAPPWLAAEQHYIQPVERISTHVWYAMGLHDFPSLYNKLSPNPVAAIPSLHSAWATLLFILVLKIYGRRWAVLAAVYPLLIYVGTIYQGEHYAFDAIAGAAYAFAAYLITPYIVKKLEAVVRKILKKTAMKRRWAELRRKFKR